MKTTANVQASVTLDECLDAIAKLVANSRHGELSQYQAERLREFAKEIEAKLNRA